MNNTTTTPRKRGGPQPGSGPKPKKPEDKVVKCHISMTQAHHAATAGDRAGMIRRALELYLSPSNRLPVSSTTTLVVKTKTTDTEPSVFHFKGYED